MAENKNTFKTKDRKTGKSVFSRLNNFLKVNSLYEKGVPVKFLPYILFISLIGVFYIGNSHSVEKTMRVIDKLRVEVEDLRADYTTLKADYMFASKQSEVAKRIKQQGIIENAQPPYKIIVDQDEY